MDPVVSYAETEYDNLKLLQSSVKSVQHDCEDRFICRLNSITYSVTWQYFLNRACIFLPEMELAGVGLRAVSERVIIYFITTLFKSIIII